MHKQSLLSVIGGALGSMVTAILFFAVVVFAAPTQAPPNGNPSFPLNGPAGPTGLTGPAGPAGPPGPAGPAGTTVAPALTVSLNPFNGNNGPGNTTNWYCTDVDLSDICMDADGCSVRVVMENKVDGNDAVRTIEAHLYAELGPMNSNVFGLTGFTRQDGGELGWISGYNNHTVIDLWGWSWMFTYRHSNCYGSVTTLPMKRFNIMTHPHIASRYYFYD